MTVAYMNGLCSKNFRWNFLLGLLRFILFWQFYVRKLEIIEHALAVALQVYSAEDHKPIA